MAWPVSAAVTAAGVAVGCPSRYNAAAPATLGLAIDVPLRTALAVSLVLQSDWMFTPGASNFTQVPKFDHDGRLSAVSMAAVVSAEDTRAGDTPQASTPLLPAAIA